MSSLVWVVTGFECTTIDKLLPDRVTGRLSGVPQTIMHASTYIGKGKPLGYAYLAASVQNMEEFEKIPLAERGLGAVSGGYVCATNVTSAGFLSKETTVNEQEWGNVDTSGGEYLCGFYDADAARFIRVMVCFDRTNVVPVSGFWSNNKVLIGPVIKCDKTDWGVNLKCKPESATFSLVLEKVKSTVVLEAKFPEVLADDGDGDGAVKTVQPEVLFSEVFTNGSSASMNDTFNLKTVLEDTHTFVLEEGTGVDWSEGWTCKAPLLRRAEATAMVDVSFAPHRLCGTSKPRPVDRSAKLTLPPMSRCRATASYIRSVVTVDAVLTVKKTYTNGATYTREVPAKYTGVSCDNAEIELESMPYVSLKRNR